uniref:hypothetical protein n=1 Tax=Enterobacter cloacae TaxID=550 RepID=UPI00155DDE08|nr:hypothetical protein [Enterobacter cloacae]
MQPAQYRFSNNTSSGEWESLCHTLMPVGSCCMVYGEQQNWLALCCYETTATSRQGKARQGKLIREAMDLSSKLRLLNNINHLLLSRFSSISSST